MGARPTGAGGGRAASGATLAPVRRTALLHRRPVPHGAELRGAPRLHHRAGPQTRSVLSLSILYFHCITTTTEPPKNRRQSYSWSETRNSAKPRSVQSTNFLYTGLIYPERVSSVLIHTTMRLVVVSLSLTFP